ncbi:DUF421 domain-containing protein [Bacillus sp. B190/17]|uniref:DUF421 domain-containing protein n=1 Tax=Bacillus lumedeiriae TaxID=3058829 RepID=A0ABW8I4L8_9BACI
MYLSITLKIIIGLIALLAVIRLLGKKELSQVTPFDFIYLLLLGSFLEEGIFDEKVSIFQVLYAIGLWGTLIYVIEMLVMKSDRARKLLKGESTDLIMKGKVDQEALKQNHIEMEQLRILMRSKGYFSLTEIEHATLETSGTLSILPKAKETAVKPGMLNITPEENTPTYLLVDEGEVKEKELKKAGKSKEWLLSELEKEGIKDTADLFYGEWSEKMGLYLIPYEEKDQ